MNARSVIEASMPPFTLERYLVADTFRGSKFWLGPTAKLYSAYNHVDWAERLLGAKFEYDADAYAAMAKNKWVRIAIDHVNRTIWAMTPQLNADQLAVLEREAIRKEYKLVQDEDRYEAKPRILYEPPVTEAAFPPGKDGCCYENAFRWARDHDSENPEIVHGTVFSLKAGRRIVHAWVEVGDEVVDPTVGVRMNKEKWYRLVQAKPDRRYTWMKAAGMMCRTKHWGPYEK